MPVKTPLPIRLLACLAALAAPALAQTLPVSPSIQSQQAPPTVLPTTAPTLSQAELDKLAEQAQRSVFQAAEKPGNAGSSASAGLPMSTINGVTQIPSGGMAPGARITTRGGRQSSNFTPPPVLTPRADDPAQWAPDSVHQLAIMDISFGATKEVVVIALYPESAPQTVANFIDLCESKFFDGLAFHRAIENFLVQTGDPLTADEDKRDQWGTGGEDRSITAEIRRPHRVGSVAMARRSDNVNPSRKSNGSQFYISLGNYSALEGKYTVFGQVVSGLDVLQHISKMPVDSNDCPVARIEVDSIRVVDQKGPMASLTGEGAKKRFRPGATRGFFDKVLERVW